ncbi:acetaldehyde dehydrogenase (acetylating) [uncultured Enterococcus sp.]|uniref:acetaldehyde dehydrogenase (acetylating) n=1 Tax=uncultured Enterococcus sp. TaxID=167972 RepID=UPI002AA800EF|nr:acetaldehyde dehydrogenase (acetylating) [uncultured Enterococcus sp.]
MAKIKAGIIGSGNIGSDLMMKLLRSKVIEPTVMIGLDDQSEGMKRAREHGLKTFAGGIDQWAQEAPDTADILFDATSANAHIHNNQIAEQLGKVMLDLTPAAIGPFVIPPVNLTEHIRKRNINMVTCGGQATVPIIAAINSVQPVAYGEIIATISSKSAGPGTRANIDEFTETTSKAIEEIGGAKKGRAIIILNPADPPILMRDTVRVLVEDQAKVTEILSAIEAMVQAVQEYVPGYHLRTEPIIEDKEITVFLEVEGAGDYLPNYAGNLDIMTSAATRVAEKIAQMNE